jgi:hypothetical protein
MSYGFVYYLTNPSMPGLTKIGFTFKHPLARMDELTKATACPTPFEMLAFFDTPTPREAERAIHTALEEFRVNPSREFFEVSGEILQHVARQWCAGSEGISFLAPLDRLVAEEAEQEAADIAAWLEKH